MRGGAEVIVLHDMGASAETRVCDPMLAVAAVDKALREQYQDDGDSIRRNVSLLLQAAGHPQRPRRHGRARPRRPGAHPVRDARVRRPGQPRARRRGLQPAAGAAEGHREGPVDARHPRAARLCAPDVGDRGPAGAPRDHRHARLRRERRAADSASTGSRSSPSSARGSAPARRATPRSSCRACIRKSGRRSPASPTRSAGYEEYAETLEQLERDQPVALRHAVGLQLAPEDQRIASDRRLEPRRRTQAAVRDQLHELRLTERDRVPRLRRGGRAGRHALGQRRGRRDPRHDRPVPQAPRPADRLGTLRGLLAADQFL